MPPSDELQVGFGRIPSATRTVDPARGGAEHGPGAGHYATALLDVPLPWTKMRQVGRCFDTLP
jgi:hypothetical protein